MDTATLTGGATGIRDAAGNPLATTSWSFTPAAATGTTRTVVLSSVADTQVSQAAPMATSGTAEILESVAGTTNRVTSYVRFTVPALGAGESITGASLSLRTTTATTAGTTDGPSVFRTRPGGATR